ncbi:MAG TPA: SDR family NAD(P)-dependent oxidoreductase [Polyangiales bacterium]|nr:SDR family NAD(P)-dependent oxidoreductase [Polyangiales bacterium]
MVDLAGKNVWITGASSGLGAALAQQCLDAGARVLLSARRADRLEVLAQGRSNVEVLPLDLAATGTLPERASEALRRMGAIDVMIHNAGIGQRGLVHESSIDVERRLMEVNFLGPVALTKAILPSMLARNQGEFVIISSVLGMMSVKRRAGYCASKHALHGYFNALRAEVHEHGLSVLLVCPGHIDSEFSQQALSADGSAHGVNEAGSRAGLSPGECARLTLRALERGRAEVYPAKWESLGVYLNRYAPALMRRAAANMKAR